jgi:hypothetical protein
VSKHTGNARIFVAVVAAILALFVFAALVALGAGIVVIIRGPAISHSQETKNPASAFFVSSQFNLSAASSCANAARYKSRARASESERASPARPERNSEPTVFFHYEESKNSPSGLFVSSQLIPFGVPSASICNPAIAGSCSSSGPGGSLFTPAKQSGAPFHAPTLPAVAG